MNLKPIKANMTELDLGSKVVLFSYRTPVAAHVDGIGYVRTSKFWSVTTSRHINQWLRGTAAGEVTEKPQEFFDSLVEVK
jgi:hypothetical protein